MYFTFPCNHCGKKLKVREDAAGRKAACPYCKASILVPTPASAPEPEAPKADGTEAFQGIGESAAKGAPRAAAREKPAASQETASSGGWSQRTDVSMLRSGLYGLVFFAGFYVLILLFVLLFKLLPIEFYPAELFLERGWVPFVLVFLLGWSLATLFLKLRKLKRQRTSMLFDLLPNELAEDITEKSVDKFIAHVHALPIGVGESFLVNRVLRGLEHFRVRKSNPEVVAMLASQSEIDANAVQSSYTLLNVFIWAIPILGFIGTVIGISAAVGGFSGALDQAQDISVLKSSLNNVTGGLATAFDTTLVALVMSIFVMFPSSSMQKAEEDLLNSVDEYCNENLLKRLNDGQEGGGGGDANSAAIRRAVDAAMVSHHAELKAWNEKLTAIGSNLTAEIVRGWGAINKEIGRQQKENVDQIRDVDSIAVSLQRSLKTLADETGTVHTQAAGAMTKSADSLQDYCSALQRGLNGLNGVLEKLGEKQVVIQGPARRRGWFFGRRNGG